MPGRSDFPDEYFEANPFEGLDPVEAYRRLQWGNEPTQIVEIDAPESLIALGELARLETLDGQAAQFPEGEYHLAIGAESNRLYIFPVGTTSIPPLEDFEPAAQVVQTDYYSEKGGEPGYYYHEHEAPFPLAMQHAASGCVVVEPITQDDGSRSYAVAPEGIIG